MCQMSVVMEKNGRMETAIPGLAQADQALSEVLIKLGGAVENSNEEHRHV